MSSSRSSSVTRDDHNDYTWVTGFADVLQLIRTYPLFTVGFLLFVGFIGSQLIYSHVIRQREIQQSICSVFPEHKGEFFNGTDWLMAPEVNLQEIHDRIVGEVASYSNVLLEDLAEIVSPIPLEQALAALQIKGEFFVHPTYRTVMSCAPIFPSITNPTAGIFGVTSIVIGFSILLIYLFGPFGPLK